MIRIRIRGSWLEQFIRFGFLSKGIFYLITGLLATRASIGTEPLTGTTEALNQISSSFFGKLVLLILAIGLAGYVLWRLIQAVIDPEHDNKLTPQGILQRLAYVSSGLSYGGVSYTVASLIMRFDEQDNSIEDLAAELTEHRWGLWLLLSGGVVAVVIGIFFIYGAYTGTYIGEFKPAIDKTVKKWTTHIGQVGYIARGVSFIVTGLFIVLAAILAESDSAGDLGSSLQQLKEQPFGALGLGLIGFGFIAYSVYMFLTAWYRRF